MRHRRQASGSRWPAGEGDTRSQSLEDCLAGRSYQALYAIFLDKSVNMSIGVNAFVQPGQTLFAALHVTTGGYVGIYPIVLAGSSTIADPTFPARAFGSQQVRFYADPKTNLDFSIARDDATADARIFVSVSGVLIDTRPKAS
jgi:hypothetical protein